MGEAHKRIRELMRASGKPVYGFADEMACSAAYHLASACREVWTTEAGHVGSVGVILCTVDESAALDKAGVKLRYLVTGARKADLHPGQPVTEEVLSVAQAKVDKLGRQFFRAVAHARGKAPGGRRMSDPAAVKALQAGVFVGTDAVAAGLADGVASWPKFLSYVKAAVRMGQAA
jgi:ClpP class serine protease